MLAYQVRKFVKGPTVTWEVWQAHTEAAGVFGSRRLRWEHLQDFSGYKLAEQFISERAGGYYDQTFDYDENGKPIFYGW